MCLVVGGNPFPLQGKGCWHLLPSPSHTPSLQQFLLLDRKENLGQPQGECQQFWIVFHTSSCSPHTGLALWVPCSFCRSDLSRCRRGEEAGFGLSCPWLGEGAVAASSLHLPLSWGSEQGRGVYIMAAGRNPWGPGCLVFVPAGQPTAESLALRGVGLSSRCPGLSLWPGKL